MGKSSSNPKLARGDHISSDRKGGAFFHHGIYVGDDMVIHLLPPENKSAFVTKSSCTSLNISSPCEKCGYRRNADCGIVKTCLACFLDGNSLYIVKHSGCCKPPEEVVQTAFKYYRNELTFRDYDTAFNNCEHFACKCKTGKRRNVVWKVAWVATSIVASFFVCPVAAIFGSGLVLKALKDSDNRRCDRY